MKHIDRIIQKHRFLVASREITSNSSLLDIGCHQGELFEFLEKKNIRGIGLDNLLENPKTLRNGEISLIKSYFPNESLKGLQFDYITGLAVFEHIPLKEQIIIAQSCYKLLRNGGKLIITIPNPFVDYILDVLLKLRLIDGMSLEEHQDIKPKQVIENIIASGLILVKHQKFQLGLNNLIVFEKPF